MIVAAIPIKPPEGDKSWAFYFINDSPEPIESVFVHSVNYEWGDSGNSTAVGTLLGPVPPGNYIEILKETETEVRTAVILMVKNPSGNHWINAEVGKLYSHPETYSHIPILNRLGKLAQIEILKEMP